MNDGNATTDNSLHVILENADFELTEYESGNVFIVDSDHNAVKLDSNAINFKWLSEEILEISYKSKLRIFKKEELNCSIQDAAHVATVAQMGNLAFRSGQKLSWDHAKHQFTDQKVNDKYLLAQYHNGYSLPKV